jgi:CheY-like chemotaxis protein
LGAVEGQANLAAGRTTVPPKVHGELVDIARGVSRAGSLAAQLEAVTGYSADGPRPVELNEFFEAAQRVIVRCLGAEGRVDFRAAASPIWIEVSPARLQQVVITLANTIRRSGAHHVEIDVAALDVPSGEPPLTHLGPGRYGCITIEANPTAATRGRGPRVQSGRQRSPLATLEGKVAAIGGRLGTAGTAPAPTWTLYFPAVTFRGDEAPPGLPTFPDTVKTVLVADDEEAVRAFIRRLLSDAGYTVLEARHGHDALQISREYSGPIDLVLSDVMMPSMGGVELAGLLQAERPMTPVIFMSGYTPEELDRIGMPDNPLLLRKPFTSHELAETVSKAVQPRPR